MTFIENKFIKNHSLIIYWKQLGDILLMEPAIAKLASITKLNVFIATKSEFLPLFLLMDNVSLVTSAVLKDISLAYSFDYRFRACIRAFFTLSSTKHLVISDSKYLKWWHKFFFKEISILDASTKYRAKYFFDAITGNSKLSFRPPKLNPPPKSWKPSNLPDRYVLIHATSAWKNKSWSPNSWAKVINELNASRIGSFVITGGTTPWETEHVNLILSNVDCEVYNLCAKTTIKEYLAVIYHANLVLSVDGSAAHIAAAFGRPVLTLFGPSHPIHWHWPTKKSYSIDARFFSKKRKPSMTSIPYKTVVNKAIQMWRLH